MTVGLLIVAHGNVGTVLLDTATALLGLCPLQTEVINVAPDCDPERITREAHKRIAALDQGAGVLVLTDLYGSTPGNIAGRQLDESVAVVSGLNLPMLIRVLNYPQKTLAELTAKAVSGGREGVMAYRQWEN